MNVNNIEIEKVTEEKAAAPEAVKDEGMSRIAAFEEWQKENYPDAYYKPRQSVQNRRAAIR